MDSICLKKKYSSLEMDNITVIKLKALAKQRGIEGYCKSWVDTKIGSSSRSKWASINTGIWHTRNTTISMNTSAIFYYLILDDPILDDNTPILQPTSTHWVVETRWPSWIRIENIRLFWVIIGGKKAILSVNIYTNCLLLVKLLVLGVLTNIGALYRVLRPETVPAGGRLRPLKLLGYGAAQEEVLLSFARDFTS